MVALRAYFRELFTGFFSLLSGMSITLRNFFRPVITLPYPRKALVMTPRFRGHIELIRDPATGEPVCTACMNCQKACPSNCITIEGIKKEGAKRRSPAQFRLDFTTCSLCGLCVEACGFDALKFSHNYNLAGTCADDFRLDLLRIGAPERTA